MQKYALAFKHDGPAIWGGVKRPEFQEDWPEAWKNSWRYDLEEVFGEVSQRGYASAYANRRARTLALLKEVLPPGSTVLDLAAAQGNFTLALAELGYHVTWNDLRGELEGYVRLKQERGTIQYAPGNAFDLNFRAPFDAVLITEVIEHVAHPDEFLKNSARLVRPGGWIMMTTPNGGYFKNKLPRFSECPNPGIYEATQFQPDSDGHIFLLHPDEIPVLAKRSGLILDRLELFTTPLTAGHLKTEKILSLAPGAVPEWIEKSVSVLPFSWKRRLLVQMAARFRKPN